MAWLSWLAIAYQTVPPWTGVSSAITPIDVIPKVKPIISANPIYASPAASTLLLAGFSSTAIKYLNTSRPDIVGFVASVPPIAVLASVSVEVKVSCPKLFNFEVFEIKYLTVPLATAASPLITPRKLSWIGIEDKAE